MVSAPSHATGAAASGMNGNNASSARGGGDRPDHEDLQNQGHCTVEPILCYITRKG
jgi:hypothetical protein